MNDGNAGVVIIVGSAPKQNIPQSIMSLAFKRLYNMVIPAISFKWDIHIKTLTNMTDNIQYRKQRLS
jgi:hypothetical protein